MRAVFALIILSACGGSKSTAPDAVPLTFDPPPSPPDSGWYPRADAHPADAGPPAQADAAPALPTPRAVIFRIQRERVVIPGTWLECQQDSDCVLSEAHCGDLTRFAVNAGFADRATARADRPCRGQVVHPVPSAADPLPVCNSGRCELRPR